MTIKHTFLYIGTLLASFSLQGAYNAYGYGRPTPPPPPTFVDPRDRVDSPPTYSEAIGAVPHTPATSRPNASIMPTESFSERIGAVCSYLKDGVHYRLEDCTQTQIAVGAVCIVAAAYGLYRTGLGMYASRKTVSALYAISHLTGAATGYSLSAVGAAISYFPTVFGASALAAVGCGAVRYWSAVCGE